LVPGAGVSVAVSLVVALCVAISHGNAVGWIVVWGVPAVGCASVGAVLCLKASGNPIGWLFLGVGVALTVGLACDAYASAGPTIEGRPAAVVVGYLFETLPVVVLPTVLLLFPSGRLPSRRWRPVGVLWLGTSTVIILNTVLAPGLLVLDSGLSVANPIGLGGTAGAILTRALIVVLVFAVIMVAAAVSLILRYRAAAGVLRQQIKWFGAGGVLIAIAALLIPVLGSIGPPWSTVVVDSFWALAITGLVITTGVAILRFRLYEIDVIIRKTLVYAGLVAILAFVYLGGIYLIDRTLQAVTGQSGALAVTLSTLAVAAAFQPLRVRLQTSVDHRFYRKKYDAALTLESFAARLRDQIELDALTFDVLDIVNVTVQPRHASVWLRPAEPTKPQASGEHATSR
jgi:hypothetical protein